MCSDRHASSMSVLPLVLDGVGYAVDGTNLLEHISMVLNPGAPTVILGANGAGKSLLLRLCHGLLVPTSGTLSWKGPGARRERRGRPSDHAMVFQRPVMLRRSVAANIDYALRLAGVPRRERRSQIVRALHGAGLGAFADRPARILSVGEQQRVALARAWALMPQVLFLDEPTASLDPSATRAVETVIGTIARSGTKIVMTTHDLAQARRLADEIIFLHRGRLIEQAPADRFFTNGPSSPIARAFVAGELVW